MRFEVLFHSRCRAPKGARAGILRAARAALRGMPAKAFAPLRKARNGTWLVNVTITHATEIRALNRRYRGKNKVTDVLSFSRLENGGPDIGDVVICGSRAREQAGTWENTLGRELQRLTVHGVLHLFGYDHERSKRDEKIMFDLQERILSRL